MDAKELAKLPPEERLTKLKELEEKAKKEIEEAHKLMEETKVEIMREERRDESAPSREDISGYLGVQSDDLEGSVAQAPRSHQASPENAYGTTLNQMRDIYSQLQDLSAEQILNRQQLTQVEEWYSNVNVALANAAKYQSQTVQEIAQASKRMIKELLGEDAIKERYIP